MKRFITFVILSLMLAFGASLSTASSANAQVFTVSSLTEVGASGVEEDIDNGYQSADEYYENSGYRASAVGPHKVGPADPGGDEPDDREDPYADPIGNGLWILLILAAGYGIKKGSRVVIK